MCALLRICLEKEREAFMNDLRPKYILPHLIKDNIITDEEAIIILKQKTFKNQVQILFDILPTKGMPAFDSFVNALNKDKAYPWLAERLQECKKCIPQISPDKDPKDALKLLAAGGVPFPINHVVHRESLVRKIQQRLKEASITGRRWICVHGMVGSGKSVLAAESVRDNKFVIECFENGVIWIPIGKIEDLGNLLYRMQNLYEMLKPTAPLTTHGDRTLNLTQQIQVIKRLILTSVAEKKKVLVVLDDVWNNSVIREFDIGCPILVTTRDKGILDDFSSFTDFIHLEHGLSLPESKELLSKYLKILPNQLPKEVEEIFKRFWGSPMVLSLIGGLMAPFPSDKERWKRVSQKLQASGNFFEAFDTLFRGKRRHPSSDESLKQSLKEAIKVSVESLTDELQPFFRDFAVFQDDVYIPNEVLEVLWDLDKYVAENVTYELCQKSLIQRYSLESSVGETTYLYMVHDLYLEFLREEQGDLKILHKKLVDQYMKLCAIDDVEVYDFGKLPNDGYIHNFIGYHLSQAHRLDLFPKIYFDFGFVQKKLWISGPSDLLNDFSLYKAGFTKCLKEMHDFENFIRRNAHLIDRDTDIIQLALLEPPCSKVHIGAKVVATSRADKFYLEICNEHHIPDYGELHIPLHQDEVNCAVFCPDNRFIASAGQDGALKVCSSVSGKELEFFKSHTATVNCCAFNSTGNKLISASSDGTVKVWNIVLSSLGRTSSQEKKRFSMGDIHAENDDNCILTFKEHLGEVSWCAFSSDDKLVVSSDNTGVAIIWNVQNGDVKQNLIIQKQPSPIRCCAFGSGSNSVATSSSGIIILWNWLLGKCLWELKHNDKFVCHFVFAQKGKIIFSIAGESVWQWTVTESPPQLIRKFRIGACNLCSCSLSPDETYLALGTSPENSIVIFNVNTGEKMTFLKKHKGNVNSVHYSNDGSKLLSASGDQSLIVWNDMEKRLLNPIDSLENNLSVRLSDQLVIATSDHLNCIQILCGYEGLSKQKSQPEEDVITTCSLSNDCSEVVYGTKSGAVKVFDVNSGNVFLCAPHAAQVTYLLNMKSSSSFITCSEDNSLRVWENKENFITLMGHSQSVVMCVLYGSDTKLLSCSADGTLRVWNIPRGVTGMVLSSDNNLRINFCDVSPDERILASASADNTVKLWDAKDGHVLRTLLCSDCVRCCRFSPSSEILATGEDSGDVTLWDLKNDSSSNIIGNHNYWVREIVFAEDGKYFASVADSIKLWDQNGNLIQRLVLPGGLAYSFWAFQNFKVFVILHNSQLYILKSIF